ncbi:uncharacterized protein LOC111006992 [Momordica charantia]|uniref:Uncharacterized protein LOC111006992 n=1 Tax=Momordica charantia TaxID=3673 RepID=A0A6J1BYU1_MOMCH|nr:uncharacterized protein LOC111006992 [Momordica charantia]
MAGTNPTGSVQDVASKGEVPERYIHKECDRGALDAPLMEAPVIDIGLLSSPSNTGPELEKLRHGLHSWGCFQAINHGMSPEFLEEVRQVAKLFFALPMEDKLKHSREEDKMEGYGNDMIFSNQQILDWTDRLYLTVCPEESRRFKYWPTNPERFREVLHEYTANVKLLSEKILKAMARSLDLDENSFLNQYGKRVQLDARFNFYLRCRNPNLVLGVKPHADGSAITILLQDKEVEGLQFLKGNEWWNAPIIPDALLVNVGDQGEITSNGIFKSRVHRVLTNSERERISLAVFYLPDPQKEIEPLEKLINETHPRLYRTVKNFVGLFFQYYQQGQRPREAAKIISVHLRKPSNMAELPDYFHTKTFQQKLLINGGDTPESYIYKDGYGGGDSNNNPLPLAEIPVVDLAQLSSSPPSTAALEDLRLALTSWGCFQAINHSISSSFLNKIHQISNQFFSLPMEEKNKCCRELYGLEGYGTDMVFSEQQILDWTDRLYLKVNPEDERQLKYWPQNPQSFREDLHEFTIKLKQIIETVLMAMARSINVEANSFTEQVGKRPELFTRFNFYPPCSRPDLVLGLKEHSDGSAITIVLLDREVEGLQWRKDDQWFRVPVPAMADSLLINIGEQAEIMSNGVFKSAVHRAVTNSEKQRISVACFCCPEKDREIEPIEGLIDERRPRLYRNVKNYVGSYFQDYQKGQRPVDKLKI